MAVYLVVRGFIPDISLLFSLTFPDDWINSLLSMTFQLRSPAKISDPLFSKTFQLRSFHIHISACSAGGGTATTRILSAGNSPGDLWLPRRLAMKDGRSHI
jgi:hypothetical protein